MWLIVLRNKIIGFLYRQVLKPVLFCQDPDMAHNRMVKFGGWLGKYGLTRSLTRLMFYSGHPVLEQNICGIKFKNPVGLSAGFDKDAYLMDILPGVGFGFEEVGSITARPFGGNQGRWLYRLPEQKSLRVNYGLKNMGAEVLHKKIAGRKFSFPVGISIAKTNSRETSVIENGIADYFFTYRLFQDAGDYITINISCPNTCEAAPIFAQAENLDRLLARLFSVPKKKPVFVKLSPDLEEEQLNRILHLGGKYELDGFICTNLTKINKFNHAGKGGFSGKAVEELSNRMINKVYTYYRGQKVIVGCGGVFSAGDAYKKIRLGASLIQLITGMIYEGPQLISEINRGLVELLRRDGYKNISEAVGKSM